MCKLVVRLIQDCCHRTITLRRDRSTIFEQWLIHVNDAGDSFLPLDTVHLALIFTSFVQSVITYALPSFAGQLSKGDKSRINALFRKALKRGLCHTPLDIDELIITVDKRLFGHISSNTHCLHHLLPPQRNARTASSLRTRGHNFTLPHTDFNLYKNSFINRCLFHLL